MPSAPAPSHPLSLSLSLSSLHLGDASGALQTHLLQRLLTPTHPAPPNTTFSSPISHWSSDPVITASIARTCPPPHRSGIHRLPLACPCPPQHVSRACMPDELPRPRARVAARASRHEGRDLGIETWIRSPCLIFFFCRTIELESFYQQYCAAPGGASRQDQLLRGLEAGHAIHL